MLTPTYNLNLKNMTQNIKSTARNSLKDQVDGLTKISSIWSVFIFPGIGERQR